MPVLRAPKHKFKLIATTPLSFVYRHHRSSRIHRNDAKSNMPDFQTGFPFPIGSC